MANNYQEFSEEIVCRTKEEYEALLNALTTSKDEEDYPPCETYGDPEALSIWLHAEESGDIEKLANIISEFQTEFSNPEPFFLSWADTCSKPRIGEFSGGAVAIYKGEAKYFLPIQLAKQWVQRKRKQEEYS